MTFFQVKRTQRHIYLQILPKISQVVIHIMFAQKSPKFDPPSSCLVRNGTHLLESSPLVFVCTMWMTPKVSHEFSFLTLLTTNEIPGNCLHQTYFTIFWAAKTFTLINMKLCFQSIRTIENYSSTQAQNVAQRGIDNKKNYDYFEILFLVTKYFIHYYLVTLYTK